MLSDADRCLKLLLLTITFLEYNVKIMIIIKNNKKIICSTKL